MSVIDVYVETVNDRYYGTLYYWVHVVYNVNGSIKVKNIKCYSQSEAIKIKEEIWLKEEIKERKREQKKENEQIFLEKNKKMIDYIKSEENRVERLKKEIYIYSTLSSDDRKIFVEILPKIYNNTL